MPKLDPAAEHASANRSALPHYDAFATHRRNLTAFAAAAAPRSGGTLCVLGAGNCYDLELPDLVERYSEVHLVDIDSSALSRTLERHPAAVRRRLVAHAPVDLSGLHPHWERWARLEVTPQEMMQHGATTALAISAQLGRSYDVVLSACMLSQMQLSLVQALGDGHPLFQAARWTLNLTHLRTLAQLTNVGGKALFVTDATSTQLFPFSEGIRGADALEALSSATQAGAVFDFADPYRLESLLGDDPALSAAFPQWSFRDGWAWTNGPETTFLVYACELPRV